MNPESQGTQNGSAVATPPDPSAGAATDPTATGSTPPPPTDNGTVEPSDAGTGNPGQSDAADGSDGNGADRSRPSRAERRISELNKAAAEYKKQAEETEAENERLREQLKDPIKAAEISLPDYSKQDQVSPEQLKQDIVNAADQIVKLRMGQIIPANNRDMTVRQYSQRAYEEMQTAIREHPELDNTNDEKYDPDLDTFIANTFDKVFKADPTYRFKDLVADVFKQRAGRGQTNTKPAPTNEEKNAKGAIRQTVSPTNKPTKSIADMTADEYKAFLRSKRS